MKIKSILFILSALGVLAVNASAQINHVWNFKGGTNFTGNYVSSGTNLVVISHRGTNFIFKIAELSSNDIIYVNERKAAQWKIQEAAIAKQNDGKPEALVYVEKQISDLQAQESKMRADENVHQIQYAAYEQAQMHTQADRIQETKREQDYEKQVAFIDHQIALLKVQELNVKLQYHIPLN